MKAKKHVQIGLKSKLLRVLSCFPASGSTDERSHDYLYAFEITIRLIIFRRNRVSVPQKSMLARSSLSGTDALGTACTVPLQQRIVLFSLRLQRT